MMHPQVRNLYKRVLIVGKDYPHEGGMEYVRDVWKKAMRKYQPPFHAKEETKSEELAQIHKSNEKDLLKAVAKGRFMVREMIGIIQLKKRRTMKQRYETTRPHLKNNGIQRYLNEKPSNGTRGRNFRNANNVRNFST